MKRKLREFLYRNRMCESVFRKIPGHMSGSNIRFPPMRQAPWVYIKESRERFLKGKQREYSRLNIISISGGYGVREPPVPIPNTEVKPYSADGTWLETARESRSPPDSNRMTVHIMRCHFFYSVNCLKSVINIIWKI